METANIIVNRLPVQTWEHLNMNRTAAPRPQIRGVGEIEASGPLSLTPADEAAESAFAAIATGSGRELEDLLRQAGIPAQRLTAAPGTAPDAVRLNFTAKDGCANRIFLDAGENAVLTVLMDLRTPAGAAGLTAVQTKIRAARGATVRLVQVQRVSQSFTVFCDIGADCAEDGRVELVQLVLSGARSFYGCEAALRGDGSALYAEVAYALARQESLDMNYVARHIGRRTESTINAAGSLRDRSAKLFRGTIDFLKGAAGSVGNEKEDVLLIDEETVNKTIPLILCAEEDVEGNHGASIGKPDDEVLFYLAARGIPEETARTLLARAKLDAAAAKICDAAFRDEIETYLKGDALDAENNTDAE